MTAFTRTWNATYESLPEDDDDALEGAARIRHIRTDVRERMEVDHHWAGDIHDGKHKKVTFRPSAVDPTLDADEIALYGKAVGSSTELFFRPEGGGSPIQLTFSSGPATVPTTTIIAFAGSTTPSGFLLCNGQAVSRTTYSALFAAIGTTFGAGDGTTTFNVPDLRGRVLAGLDNMGGAAAGRLTVFAATSPGAVGGAQTHALVVGELASHAHGVSDPGHAHGVSDPGHTHTHNAVVNSAAGGGLGSGGDLFSPATINAAGTGISIQGAGTGISIQAAGSGTAHNNVQPTMALNFAIKT